jgi:hypothetical protein
LDDVQTFYDSTVFGESRSRIVIQLKGQRYGSEPFGTIDESTVVDDVDQFHRDMPRQSL